MLVFLPCLRGLSAPIPCWNGKDAANCPQLHRPLAAKALQPAATAGVAVRDHATKSRELGSEAIFSIWNNRSRSDSQARSMARAQGPPTYRLWKYVTWRARLHLWCNEIKSVCCNDNSARAPADVPPNPRDSVPGRQSNYLARWWDGEAVPGPSPLYGRP